MNKVVANQVDHSEEIGSLSSQLPIFGSTGNFGNGFIGGQYGSYSDFKDSDSSVNA
jgi:hypothetical protein